MPWCSVNFTYIPVKATAQTLMLLAHWAINHQVQGSKLAQDIFLLSQTFKQKDQQVSTPRGTIVSCVMR